jgi:hypothetical protein
VTRNHLRVYISVALKFLVAFWAAHYSDGIYFSATASLFDWGGHVEQWKRDVEMVTENNQDQDLRNIYVVLYGVILTYLHVRGLVVL